jgi:hypothetical protein
MIRASPGAHGQGSMVAAHDAGGTMQSQGSSERWSPQAELAK